MFAFIRQTFAVLLENGTLKLSHQLTVLTDSIDCWTIRLLHIHPNSSLDYRYRAYCITGNITAYLAATWAILTIPRHVRMVG